MTYPRSTCIAEILKHSPDAPLAGLDTVPRENWPPVAITFWSFRIMVGLGFLIMGLGLLSLWMRWRGTLYQSRLLHLFAMAMGPAGFIAVLAGWTTTEVGRQPWTVYGVMRTAHSVTPSLTGIDVLLSLVGYMAVYLIMFPAGLWMMLRIVRGGVSKETDSPVGGGRPSAPVKSVPGDAS